MLHLSPHSASTRTENWISSTEQIDCMQWARQRRDLFPNSSTARQSSSLISTVYSWKDTGWIGSSIPVTRLHINLYVLPSALLIPSVDPLAGDPQPIKPDLHKSWGKRRAKFGEIAEWEKAIYGWKIRASGVTSCSGPLIYTQDTVRAAGGRGRGLQLTGCWLRTCGR